MPDAPRQPTEQRANGSQRRPTRAELIWEGKYDANGKRVAPLRVALPFQTVETINESNQERQRGFLFESPSAYRAQDWRNRLIWGDKKYVLPSLLAEFVGKVNLIYIDPPFDTGADFSFTATVPDDPDALDSASISFTKEPSIIEHKAYRDTWGRGLDSYLQWFYETVLFLHELLHETGSLYVHLDWHVSHAAKCVLDEVFGSENCLNEIIWKRTSARSDSHTYNHIHDVIFLYSRSENFTFHVQHTPYDQTYLDNFYRYVEPKTNRRFRVSDLMAGGTRNGSSGRPWRGVDPNSRGNHWKYTIEKLEELDRQGRIFWPQKEGGVPGYKRYLDEMPGVPLQSIWTDINPIAAQAIENVGYDTQKPESLLDRIVKASSNEGDLVLDCFCGSGTTAAVAEKLKRRWIACDLGRFAIHTTRKRLLSIPDVRPFIVQNLGKYERQLWAGAQFGDANSDKAAMQQRAYIEFILKLYQATPLHGYTWLHGVRGGRMVHIGAVDAPVTSADVTQIAAEFKRAIGTGRDAPKTNGVDILGWDFAFELNEIAKQQAAAANIQVRFVRIPHDAMDKRAAEQGDVRFFELAALSVETKVQKRNVLLRLKDFVIPPDDVPQDVSKAVKHWSQWIDYWAVDWDNKGDTFHNEWQTYRTRKNNTLALETAHVYGAAGDYKIVVKVIDILGNDTTKTVTVKVS